MRLALCARRRDRLEALAAELGARGAEVSIHPLDITDETAVRAMVDEVARGHGALDVLVNNAARGLAARFEDTTLAEFRALLELNLLAPIVAIQAALPHMRRQGRGHVINVSSVVGRRNIPGRAAYGATKFALGAVSEALRLELRGTGIVVASCTRSTRRPSSTTSRRGAWRCAGRGRPSPRTRSRARSCAVCDAHAPRSIPTGRRGSSPGSRRSFRAWSTAPWGERSGRRSGGASGSVRSGSSRRAVSRRQS